MGDLFTFETGSVSHPGLVREVNEDSLVVRPDLGIWAVADGMGGHQAGDLASNLVAARLEEIGVSADLDNLVALTLATVEGADAELRVIAERRGIVVGTTLAVLLIGTNQFAVLWSGDSRIYRADATGLLQLTRDHTVVGELVDAGSISPEEARRWPGRNVITRAVGAADPVCLDVARGTLQDGDTFLLCSDGLTGCVEDEEIFATLGASSCQEACEALLEATLSRGARDNVTIVALRCHRRELTVMHEHPTAAIRWE